MIRIAELTNFQESGVRKKIDQILRNKGWNIDEESADCNVFTERPKTKKQKEKLDGKQPDYLLYESGTNKILAVIEAKKPDQNIQEALEQGKERYAEPLDVPVVFATDGTIVRTYHLEDGAELKKDGVEVSDFLTEKELKKFYDSAKVSSPEEVAYTRKELIEIFERANDLLRKDGLREGVERFTEFSNILFLKMISEIEDQREEEGLDRRFDERYCWDYFKDWEGQRILDYINDTILPKLVDRYNHSGDVFQNELKLKNPETMKEIVERLSEIDILTIDSDVKGDAFEYFLKESVTVGNDLGEYFTPRHIVELMTELADPKFGETIYDPCCGTGGFLISAYQHIWDKCKHTEENIEQLQEETVFGRELTGTAQIAKMNMILAGDGHTNIVQMDSLSEPVEEEYDLVLTNFPFSQETDYAQRYGFDTEDANPVFLKHIIDSLEEGGRAAVVTFQGVLYDNNNAYKKIRKHLLTECDVKAVIKLHNYVFQPYTGVNTSILVFEKGEPTEDVWFFEVENDGFEKTTSKKGRPPIEENDLKLLKDVWDTKEDTEKSWTVDIEEIKENDWSLNADTYKQRTINEDQATIEPILEVTDLVKDTVEEFEGERKYLETGGLEEDRIKELNSVTYNDRPDRANLEVHQDDVIFAKMQNTNKNLLIDEETDNLIVSTGFVVLHPEDENELDPEFLKYIVSSDKFLEQKNRLAHGATQEAINEQDDLGELRIPVPNIMAQKRAVKNLKAIQSKINNIKDLIESYQEQPIDDTLFPSENMTPLGDLMENGYPQNGLYKKKSFYGSGTPIVRIDNIYNGQFFFDDLKRLEVTDKELENYNLEEGEIVINRVNSEEYIGKCAVYEGEFEECVFESNMMRFGVDESKVLPKYVAYYLSSPEGRQKILSKIKRSINQVSINQGDVKSLEIPLVSLEKQKGIIEEIERQFEAIDELREIQSSLEKQKENELSRFWED